MPCRDTQVSYPDGATDGSSTVLHVEALPDGRQAVLLEATPVHPVDFAWPDQGADRAWLQIGGEQVPVLDCVVGAVADGRLHLGGAIPVRKGTEGWAFVVAHIVGPEAAVEEGGVVGVQVDASHRAALSAGHTGCHLASLALNRELAGAWRKDVPLDAAGHPNFDALAIDTSTILPDGSRDVYRLGKSLRRRGFQPEEFLGRLEDITDRVNAVLARWTASQAAVAVEREGGRGLTDLRRWTCALPEGTVSIPCGGTHVASLADLLEVRVHLQAEEAAGAVVVTMDTRSPRR